MFDCPHCGDTHHVNDFCATGPMSSQPSTPMTHPLTPREKVANMPTVELTDDMLFEIAPGEVVTWAEIRRRTALASGSGDHAELVRDLRRADEYGPLGHDGWKAADAIDDLLAENAALRAANDVLEVERIGLRSAIFGSHEYDPALRHGNFIEMARATEDARKGAIDRATEAERKLAEAVGLLRRWMQPDGQWSANIDTGAWLSKEAERG